MKYEILKLLKAVSVSSTTDLNQIVLQKLNKGPLATFLSSMVKLVENNLILCGQLNGSNEDKTDRNTEAAYGKTTETD